MADNKKTKRKRITDYQELRDKNKISVDDLDKSDWIWLLRH